MDDKTAIKNLKRWENVNTRVTYAHAVDAIEKLTKVRAIVAEWSNFSALPDDAMAKLEKLLEVKP